MAAGDKAGKDPADGPLLPPQNAADRFLEALRRLDRLFEGGTGQGDDLLLFCHSATSNLLRSTCP